MYRTPSISDFLPLDSVMCDFGISLVTSKTTPEALMEVVMFEVFNEFSEIAERTKKPVKQHQRFSFAFFNKPEFVLLFYLVFHLVFVIAKVIDLLQKNDPFEDILCD